MAPSGGLLPLTPAWLDCTLGICHCGVVWSANLAVFAALSVASSPPLCLVPVLMVLSGGSASFLEAVAVLSGAPVPAMAVQALGMGGWRFACGASALGAWTLGWHSPFGLGSCRALGLVVVSAGSWSPTWGAYLACEAALCFPTFPPASSSFVAGGQLHIGEVFGAPALRPHPLLPLPHRLRRWSLRKKCLRRGLRGVVVFASPSGSWT